MNKSIWLYAIAFSFFTFFHAGASEARTWPTKHYQDDRSANFSFAFPGFEKVANYQDPDPGLIPRGLKNPLEDERYITYKVIVVANQSSSNYPELAQTVRVYVRGEGLVYFWKMSTARPGKVTPSGYFTPEGFSSQHRSSIYNNARMPWAVFFNNNIASHGITGKNIKKLGKRASAGCLRLEPQRAQHLFHLVGHSGYGSVEQIGRNGNKVRLENGLPKFAKRYQALYIIK